MKFTDPTGEIEEGFGNTIKHPDKYLFSINKKDDEILTVVIETKPANPPDGTGISLEPVFRYNTEVTVINESKEALPDVKSTLFYINSRGGKNDNGASVDPSNRIVETVAQDNEGTSNPEPRSATVEVKGQKKDIDYKVHDVGNTVQVVPGYDNKIVIPAPPPPPGTPTYILVPTNNKPDPIEKAMRPTRNKLDFSGVGY